MIAAIWSPNKVNEEFIRLALLIFEVLKVFFCNLKKEKRYLIKSFLTRTSFYLSSVFQWRKTLRTHHTFPIVVNLCQRVNSKQNQKCVARYQHTPEHIIYWNYRLRVVVWVRKQMLLRKSLLLGCWNVSSVQIFSSQFNSDELS